MKKNGEFGTFLGSYFKGAQRIRVGLLRFGHLGLMEFRFEGIESLWGGFKLEHTIPKP